MLKIYLKMLYQTIKTNYANNNNLKETHNPSKIWHLYFDFFVEFLKYWKN